MNILTHESTDVFTTSDLSLVVTLSLHHPILEIRKNVSGRAQFLFKRNENLVAHVEDYWSGKLLVDPRAFFNQLRDVKARLYA